MSLTLTRKRGEWIQIGPDVRVYVGRSTGKATRVTVEAPDGMKILRGELVERDQAAAKARPADAA